MMAVLFAWLRDGRGADAAERAPAAGKTERIGRDAIV